MTTNRIINISQRIFSFLLKLYPREHREEYASSMYQVFTDECREANSRKGVWGVLSLWLRVIPDLGYTSILEHLASPGASLGLLEPVPNAPLPWKGVFLVLLPGLVYLVSQIAQLVGEPWYLTVYYRAAFILIIPVLVVWVITKKFPIWGLIPVGLLFKLVKEIGYQLVTLNAGTFSQNPFLDIILKIARTIENNLWILTLILFSIALFLAFRHLRYNKPNRVFWFYLGGFLLVVIGRIVYDFVPVLNSLNMIPDSERQVFLQDLIQYSISYTLYNAVALLFLVFTGTLFTQKHGFFAIFILVGYILPVMVIGIPWFQETNDSQMIILGFGVLLYRSLLSLVAPIWMSRSSTQSGKRRVIIYSIFLALAVHAIMQFYPAFFNLAERIDYPNWIQYVAMEELLLIFTFLMGIALYQSNELVVEDHTIEENGSRVLTT